MIAVVVGEKLNRPLVARRRAGVKCRHAAAHHSDRYFLRLSGITPGQRDRALLLVGFAGALRRSELVALDVAHLALTDEGFVVTIAKSKTDQEAQGQTIAIPRVSDSPYCPVQAVLEWMAMAGIEHDALFRRVTKGNKLTADRLTDQSVARVIKRLAARAGLMASQYAGHSLRSGFLTSAAEQRASIFKMQAQSRHKSLDVLSGYVRAQELFEDHAGEGLLTSKDP